MIEEHKLRAAVRDAFDLECIRVPYGREIRHELETIVERSRNGERIACLVPARTDTGWWWDYCRFGEVRFLRSRVRFQGEKSGAPFASAVVVFGPGSRAESSACWDVNTGELRRSPATYVTFGH